MTCVSELICERCGQVHVLGWFTDDALALDEYRALDPDGEFMDARTAFIVTPFFCGGDLESIIKKGRPIPEPTVLSILAQVIDAVVKLQKHNRAHRDLKPDNVFFCGDHESLALADFGEVGDLHLDFKKGQTSAGGAPDYLAPEILAQISSMADGSTAEIDYAKNDVYAVGIIAFKLCMHDMNASPWPDASAPSAERLRQIPPDAYSESLRTFIERGLLSPDPAQRMTAQEAQRVSTNLRFGGGDVHPVAHQPAARALAPAPAPAVAAELEPEPQLDLQMPGAHEVMALLEALEAEFLGLQDAEIPHAGVIAAPRWEWCGDGDQWQQYSATLSGQLEAAYQCGGRHVDIDSDHYADPIKMLQKCWHNDSRRRIRRIVEGVPRG